MTTRTLGRSGLRVSRLGLGLAALGRPGYITLGHAEDLQRDYDVEHMQSRAERVLDAAWEAGVRYFDAARSYGRAEEFLGAWLRRRGIDRDAVCIGSKWGYTYVAAWSAVAERHEVKEHRLDVLRRQIVESRAHLDGFLGLYQVHSATLDSGVLQNDAVLNELADLRRAGLGLGLTLSGVDQAATLRHALEVQRDGAPLFDTVQATWNLLEPSAGPLLAEAHSRGIGVIVKESVANGRLTERNRETDFAPRLDRLRRIAAKRAASIDAVAVAAALAQPWADVVLSGAATVLQLQSHRTALDLELSEAELAELARLAEPPDRYWNIRSRLPWN